MPAGSRTNSHRRLCPRHRAVLHPVLWQRERLASCDVQPAHEVAHQRMRAIRASTELPHRPDTDEAIAEKYGVRARYVRQTKLTDRDRRVRAGRLLNDAFSHDAGYTR